MRLYNILRMKSLSVNELVFATSVLLWDLCLRLYVLVFVIGKRLFSTWLLLYRTWENRSLSASSTSSARDNWLKDESPGRMPRRMTASSLCLSVAVVKPHHALLDNKYNPRTLQIFCDTCYHQDIPVAKLRAAFSKCKLFYSVKPYPVMWSDTSVLWLVTRPVFVLVL